MTKIFLTLWRWSYRREDEIDWSATCFGALGLTIMLSQKLWSEWPSVAHGSFLIFLIESCWLYLLGLIAVFCYEGLHLIKLLRRYDRSTWWILPLMFFLVGVSSPPSWNKVVSFSVIAFIVIHYPLFWNRTIRKDRDPITNE
jgi:hypothetical protein